MSTDMIICEDSLTKERALYQESGGGVTPTSSLHYRIEEWRYKDIRHIFEAYHYKGGHMGGGISVCYCLKQGDKIVAGAVVGKPRHDTKYSREHRTLEIRRLACLDECPKNTESYFLAKIVWMLRKSDRADEVISYSDKSVGHKGTIYKAANFKLIGETAPSKHVFWKGVRYHPRSLTIDRPYSYRLREAIKTGEATVETGEAKLIFSYVLKKGVYRGIDERTKAEDNGATNER